MGAEGPCSSEAGAARLSRQAGSASVLPFRAMWMRHSEIRTVRALPGHVPLPSPREVSTVPAGSAPPTAQPPGQVCVGVSLRAQCGNRGATPTRPSSRLTPRPVPTVPGPSARSPGAPSPSLPVPSPQNKAALAVGGSPQYRDWGRCRKRQSGDTGVRSFTGKAGRGVFLGLGQRADVDFVSPAPGRVPCCPSPARPHT